LKTAIMAAVVLIALGAGAYFGWPMFTKWREKSNAGSSETTGGGGGGQVGHIAEVNGVLDATENLASGGGTRSPGSKGRRASAGANAAGAPGAAPATEDKLPILPAVYTLEVTTAKIPEGRANGTLSGTNFVVENARIDAAGGAQVLRLSQGSNTAPDLEILVYLHLKAGETLAGYNLNIAQDLRTGVPQVVKRWKSNPRYALQSKSFPYGYAMKLELGQPAADGAIPGKIFLALPDPETSVVAGIFKAASSPSPAAAAGTAAAPAPAPQTPAGASGDKAAFDKRYGIKR
jgi:hypothetical protein